jgi:hypothetical protein
MKPIWKRLVWVLFICLYSALFFYNCFRPFNDWLVPYVFTLILVIWLSYEYYIKRLFFQSGLIPDALYIWPARALFALFFYSAFVIGIATVIWWPKNQIGLYPSINILGLVVLLVSVYLRQKALRVGNADQNAVRRFYLSVLLIISLPLGYGSLFLALYTTVIGLPLLYWNYEHERKVLGGFADYVRQQTPAGKEHDYAKLWDKYLQKTKR